MSKMVRRSIKNELKSFGFGVLYAYISLESVNIMADWYTDADLDHYWPGVVSAGLVAFGRFCNYQLQKPVSITTGQMEGRRKVLISGKPTLLSSVPLIGGLRSDHKETRMIKYREPRPIEFFWDVPIEDRVAVVRVYETRLRNLCESAHRRQRSNLLPDSKYPFSRNYFTKEYRPRFPIPLYSACMRLLTVCNLLDGRSQGTSGQLRYRPASTVELAKEWFSPDLVQVAG